MAKELRNWDEVIADPDGGQEETDDGINDLQPSNPNALPITLYFHGACEPVNPKGTATYGWWIADQNNTCLGFSYDVIGTGDGMTNHVADYHALGFGLQFIKVLTNLDWHVHKLVIRGSSQLVVNQVEGVWQCNSQRLRPLKQRCEERIVELYKFMPNWIVLEVIPVELNRKASELSKRAYDTLPHEPDRVTDQTIPPRNFGDPVMEDNT